MHKKRRESPSVTASKRGARSAQQRCVLVRAGPQVDKGFSLLEWTSKLVPQGALVTGAKQGWRLAWQAMVRELAPQDSGGGYSRPQYAFDDVIGSPQYPAVAGRYHLYVGNACPWCHRCLLALAVRGVSGAVTVTRLLDEPERATRGGWVMPPGGDPVFGAKDLWEVYDRGSPGFKGRCTAPLLVDKATRRLISNESASIVRQLGEADLPGANGVDLYPEALRSQIDDLNGWIYPAVNNGVYRCGFATTQAAYDAASSQLHAALEKIDGILAGSRFLIGDRFTEADLCLFPTIARFDATYSGLFRCGRRRVADYQHLQGWMRDVHQIKVPGGGMQVCDAFDVDEARRSYYSNLFPLNPSGIVPSGPTAADLRLDAPHGRGSSAALEDVFWLKPQRAAAAAAAQ